VRSIAIGSTGGRPANEVGDDADRSISVVERFVDAVARVDYRAIFASLAPGVRFRFLIPSGPGQLVGAADVAARYLDWFGDCDVVEVRSVLVAPLADRVSARYRFMIREHGRWEVVEQQTFVDVDELGRISALDLLCSGFRSTNEGREDAMSGPHRFDAGTRSCADGLAQEFRREILAIPLGDVLEVETADPAAKEDLPPLARMMGHTVLSVEPSEGGRLLISVERGR
jgi:TusA-related sulfurtransferase